MAHFIYGLLISRELCADVYQHQQPRPGSEASMVWKEIVCWWILMYWCHNWRTLHSANTSLHSPPLTGLVNKTLNDFIIISDKRKQPIINLEHFGQCRISGIPKTTSVIAWMASVSTLDVKYLHSTAPSSEYQALRHSAAWSSRLVMSGGKEGHIRVTSCLLLTLPCK